MSQLQLSETNGSVAASQVSAVDLGVLLREATSAARGLARKLGLPVHDQDDLRQELLVDLIVRLKWFDPGRGTLGAFAGVIVRHQARQLANRINGERAFFVPTSRGDSYLDEGGVADCDGFGAVLGQSHASFAAIEQRLDLARALGALRPGEFSLCAKLVEHTPTEITRSENLSRASFYRRLKKIRLKLREEGVSWP